MGVDNEYGGQGMREMMSMPHMAMYSPYDCLPPSAMMAVALGLRATIRDIASALERFIAFLETFRTSHDLITQPGSWQTRELVQVLVRLA